jgi:MFS family permease
VFGRWHLRVLLSFGLPWSLAGLEVTLDNATSTAPERALTGLLGAAGALVFGQVADRYGRNRAFVLTLAMHAFALLGALAHAGSWTSVCSRVAIGLSLGGIYCASVSAVVELVPARLRAALSMTLYGSYGLGVTLAVALLGSLRFLPDEASVAAWSRSHAALTTAAFKPSDTLMYALIAGFALSAAVAHRRTLESPRWLDFRGQHAQALRALTEIEWHFTRGSHAVSTPPVRRVRVEAVNEASWRHLALLVTQRLRSRAVLCATLMVGQAFVQHTLLLPFPFAQAHVLSRFYSVRPEHLGRYLLPIALAGMLGPFALGPLFDRVGRRVSMLGCWVCSGMLLLFAACAGAWQWLSAEAATALWAGICFCTSAAVAAAYLAASELFPLAVRARAFALFYALGAVTSQLLAPLLFGAPIPLRSPNELAVGYVSAALGMWVAAFAAYRLGVPAERTMLEDLRDPERARRLTATTDTVGV